MFMDMKLKFNMFGRETCITWDFAAKNLIGRLDKLMDAVKQQQILCHTGLDTITFKGYANSDEPYTSDFQVLEWVCCKLGWDGKDIRQFILDHSNEDKEWTEWRNRDLTGIFYRKITLGKDVQELIIKEATAIQNYLRVQLDLAAAETAAKEKAAADEKAKMLDGVEWKTTEKAITDEGGKTYEYTHTIKIDGEQFIIIERSVFDFGRVLNPLSGGMYGRREGKWCIEHLTDKGWVAEPISENQARAAEIVWKYGEYAGSCVRM